VPFEIIRWLSIFGASFASLPPAHSVRALSPLARSRRHTLWTHARVHTLPVQTRDTRYLSHCGLLSALSAVESQRGLPHCSVGRAQRLLPVRQPQGRHLPTRRPEVDAPVIAGVECPHTARLSVHRRSSRHARAIPTVTLSVRVVWVLHTYTSRVLVPTEYSSTCRATQGKPGRQLRPVPGACAAVIEAVGQYTRAQLLL
jgi:hypothetical protein